MLCLFIKAGHFVKFKIFSKKKKKSSRKSPPFITKNILKLIIRTKTLHTSCHEKKIEIQ